MSSNEILDTQTTITYKTPVYIRKAVSDYRHRNQEQINQKRKDKYNSLTTEQKAIYNANRKAKRDSMTPEQKEKHKQYMLEYRKRPDIIARENKRAFDKREQRKAEELQTGIGIKIKKGVIIERDMNDNLPKIISQDEDAYTPLYTPFGINSPEKNALYEQHKDYVEGKINELSYKTQNQVYYCEECEVQVARATTVVLRRHFSTFKHLKNAGILTPSDKPFKKRKPYTLKRNRGVINPVLAQSFHESVEEGATL